ncbi:hypothetical protein [Gordonia sp. SND2]|uniref:hypothetical protein n=1 Tax=Gordonia sp. SND2 TaxID=3388659 RepID=UPI00398A6F18
MTTTSTTRTPIQWGLSWSGRWHALRPSSDKPVSVCSGHELFMANESGQFRYQHLNKFAQSPKTPTCKLCEKKVGPKGGVA